LVTDGRPPGVQWAVREAISGHKEKAMLMLTTVRSAMNVTDDLGYRRTSDKQTDINLELKPL